MNQNGFSLLFHYNTQSIQNYFVLHKKTGIMYIFSLDTFFLIYKSHKNMHLKNNNKIIIINNLVCNNHEKPISIIAGFGGSVQINTCLICL